MIVIYNIVNKKLKVKIKIMTENIITDIRRASGYDEIIYYLVNMCKIGNKYSIVSYTDKNPLFSTNFWRLYKKEAKNEKAQKLFNFMFPKAKVWKSDNNSWRFYYNETHKEIGERYSKYLLMERTNNKYTNSKLILELIKNMSYEEILDYSLDLIKVIKKERTSFSDILKNKTSDK